MNPEQKQARITCGCFGHRYPGVMHMVACCAVPHITFEEYVSEYGG